MSSLTYIHLIGESETNIWGLSGRTRLQRMLQPNDKIKLVDHIEEIPKDAPVLLLYANYLFDSRVLTALLEAKEKCILYSDENKQVAIYTNGNEVARILKVLSSGGHADSVSTLSRLNIKDLKIDVQQNLKKKDRPYVLPITTRNREQLESELFAQSYKGVTDLVTKWLWPIPASWATHLCIKKGWQPNDVTLLSYLFAALTCLFFYLGFYGTGLIIGWIMTFLDTVDGKLARVTVTSSRMGDVLDHGLDLIHPPLWYIAWGLGLASTTMSLDTVQLLILLMLIGYIGGRICEGIFEFWLAPFSVFIWRQWDSFNRLITARRNPNLILLTFSWFIARPDLGFIFIVLWHLISTAILGWRILIGWRTRKKDGKLQSWLQDIDSVKDRDQLAVRLFTREPLSYKNPTF